MVTVFEPMRPVPPMTTIFMVYPPLSMSIGILNAVLPMTVVAGVPPFHPNGTHA
jgi:hypothetical protein